MEKLARLLDEGQFVGGDELENFEAAYARFSGVNHAAGLSNGTDALTAGLHALGIGAGHAVLLPANTFMATALAVLAVGAKLVLAEPDELTYNLTAETAKAALTHNTTTLLPVHLYGRPCAMDGLMQLAGEKSLFVVEDNAQAQGARYKGRMTGSFGHINATSFYPSKNLGALGDAGAITTDNPELFAKVCLWRNLGSAEKYVHETLGRNARLDTLQAAFLLLKLEHLENWNTERRRMAARYTHNLRGCAPLVLPADDTDGESVFHLYVVRAKERAALQDFLANRHIQTLIHYPTPIHRQPAFRELGYAAGDFPLTERLAGEVLSLPLYIGMTDAEIDYVCEHITQFYK